MAKRICLMLVALMVGVVLGSSVMAKTDTVISFVKEGQFITCVKAYERQQANNLGTDADAEFYKGFVLGVIEVHQAYTTISQIEGKTTGQVLAVVAKYFNDHPEEWHYVPSSVVIRAIDEAFPPQQETKQPPSEK
jgi:hypothetical protein